MVFTCLYINLRPSEAVPKPPRNQMLLNPLLGAQLKWSQRSPLSILQKGHSVCQFLNEGAETEGKIRSIILSAIFLVFTWKNTGLLTPKIGWNKFKASSLAFGKCLSLWTIKFQVGLIKVLKKQELWAMAYCSIIISIYFYHVHHFSDLREKTQESR